MHTVTIHGQMQLAWSVRRVGSVWLGQCDALKLCIEGDTPEDLDAAIRESIDLLLRSLLESNKLDAFLRARGWTLASGIPANLRPDDLTFRAPIKVEKDLYACA